MEFRLSEEEEKFQKDVHDFLAKEVTEEVVLEAEGGQGFGPHAWGFIRKLGARGWLCPMLPKEYGGFDAPFMFRWILNNEQHYFLPEMLTVNGASIVAPTINLYGTEEQKKEYLPRIARGEIEFALGYSEPGSGSDLASVSTRAVEQEDCYVINGQKTYNTGCHYAQYYWLLVRTEDTTPKHRGLSLFIVDMKSQGIALQAMHTLAGERTNEVFLDNVRVPKENLVGQKNRGFYHVATALDYERVFPIGHCQRTFEGIVEYATEAKRNGMPLTKNPLVRQELAQRAVEIEVGRMLAYRTAWQLGKGIVGAYEAAALKIFVSELEQRLGTTGMHIMGLYGQLQASSKWVPLQGMLELWHRSRTRRTISAGTSEIQRNVIATRGLGLPR